MCGMKSNLVDGAENGIMCECTDVYWVAFRFVLYKRNKDSLLGAILSGGDVGFR